MNPRFVGVMNDTLGSFSQETETISVVNVLNCLFCLAGTESYHTDGTALSSLPPELFNNMYVMPYFEREFDAMLKASAPDMRSHEIRVMASCMAAGLYAGVMQIREPGNLPFMADEEAFAYNLLVQMLTECAQSEGSFEEYVATVVHPSRPAEVHPLATSIIDLSTFCASLYLAHTDLEDQRWEIQRAAYVFGLALGVKLA